MCGLHWAHEARAGELDLTYRSANNRKIPVLQLLGAERLFPNLYEPKVVELSGNMLRFIGCEAVDGACVMQEWRSELP